MYEDALEPEEEVAVEVVLAMPGQQLAVYRRFAKLTGTSVTQVLQQVLEDGVS